ncbi:MAG: GNAT family N-acetyltransferase [Chitinophagaceae bacterium]
MNVTVRYAAEEDSENIARLSRQTFYDTFASFNKKQDMDKFMEGCFSMTALIEECSATENTFLVAFINEEMVGYAKLSNSSNPPELENMEAIEISRIYAAQKSIGRGVGQALMEACIGIAKEKNKQVVWLGVWEENKRAITFYQKFGFERFSAHDFVLGDDVQTDWLMKKII